MKLKYLRYVYLNLSTNTDIVFYKVYVFNMTERLFDPIEVTKPRFFFPWNPIFENRFTWYTNMNIFYRRRRSMKKSTILKKVGYCWNIKFE